MPGGMSELRRPVRSTTQPPLPMRRAQPARRDVPTPALQQAQITLLNARGPAHLLGGRWLAGRLELLDRNLVLAQGVADLTRRQPEHTRSLGLDPAHRFQHRDEARTVGELAPLG